jgi:hypothetical protein
MELKQPFSPTSRKRGIRLLAKIIAAALLSATAHAGQWSASQFSNLDPVLTFETGTTALPGIHGIHFTPYGSAEISAFSSGFFGGQCLGNVSGPGGYTLLDITFDEPQQAVGGYVNSQRPGFYNVGSVTEVVFDQNNNVIDSASVSVPYNSSTPIFLGLGEATTNIYKVEWRYGSATFFGVDNVIFQPGLQQIAMTNVLISGANISFTFQTLPGHTNMIQTGTNLATGNWITVTNMVFLGMGETRKISFPLTNSPSAYFRVQAQ